VYGGHRSRLFVVVPGRTSGPWATVPQCVRFGLAFVLAWGLWRLKKVIRLGSAAIQDDRVARADIAIFGADIAVPEESGVRDPLGFL
jgi:hypothetical protein